MTIALGTTFSKPGRSLLPGRLLLAALGSIFVWTLPGQLFCITPTGTVWKDSSGNPVACLSAPGHLILKGELKQNQSSIPTGGSQKTLLMDGSTCLVRVEQDAGSLVFPNGGVFFQKGALLFGTHPIAAGNYPLKLSPTNDGRNAICGIVDSSGNLRLDGLLCENRQDPAVFPGGQLFLSNDAALHDLRRALNRMKTKDQPRVAVLGGSITQGKNSPGSGDPLLPSSWYATRVVSKLRDLQYINSTATPVILNAGRAGFGSDSAACRLYDIMKVNPGEAGNGTVPDLVIIDCSANDYASFGPDDDNGDPNRDYRKSQRSMEGPLRQILNMRPRPGVILLSLVYSTLNGNTSEPPYYLTSGGVPYGLQPTWCTFQDRHLALAQRYQVPVVSFRDEYWAQALNGTIDPKLRSYYNYTEPIPPTLPYTYVPESFDWTHPNNTGHGKLADLVGSLLDKAKWDDTQSPPIYYPPNDPPAGELPARLMADRGDAFQNMVEISPNNLPTDVAVTLGGWTVENSIPARKFNSAFGEENYSLRGWKVAVQQEGGAAKTLTISFSGTTTRPTEIIAEYCFQLDGGKMICLVNGQPPLCLPSNPPYQAGFIQEACTAMHAKEAIWKWIGWDLAGNSEVTFTTLPGDAGRYCYINRLWVTNTANIRN